MKSCCVLFIDVMTRVVSWEISRNFLRTFSGNFGKNNCTFLEKFHGNFQTVCDIKNHETQQQMSTVSPNRLRKIKEQLSNGKSHYGQWTWSLDTTWMDDELMMDWLMDGCFPLFYLLAYLLYAVWVFQKNSGKFPALCFCAKVTTLVMTHGGIKSMHFDWLRIVMKSVIHPDCVALFDLSQSTDFTLISRNGPITLGLFKNKKVQHGNVKCGLKTATDKIDEI